MNDGLDNDSAQVWTLLLNLILDGEKRLAAQLQAHGLTPPQFYVIKTLFERGGHCPIGQIARAHHLTNATMTGLVKRLESMQPPLVVREPHASDKRSVMVSLTAEGSARFFAVQTDFIAQLRVVLGLVDDQTRQRLLDDLARYSALLSAFTLQSGDDTRPGTAQRATG